MNLYILLIIAIQETKKSEPIDSFIRNLPPTDKEKQNFFDPKAAEGGREKKRLGAGEGFGNSD